MVECNLQFKLRKWDFFETIERVARVNEIRSTRLRKFLYVESLFLRTKRASDVRLDHASKMPREKLTRLIFFATPRTIRLLGRRRTRWINYISNLACSKIGINPDDLPVVPTSRHVSTNKLTQSRLA